MSWPLPRINRMMSGLTLQFVLTEWPGPGPGNATPIKKTWTQHQSNYSSNMRTSHFLRAEAENLLFRIDQAIQICIKKGINEFRTLYSHGQAYFNIEIIIIERQTCWVNENGSVTLTGSFFTGQFRRFFYFFFVSSFVFVDVQWTSVSEVHQLVEMR